MCWLRVRDGDDESANHIFHLAVPLLWVRVRKVCSEQGGFCHQATSLG